MHAWWEATKIKLECNIFEREKLSRARHVKNFTSSYLRCYSWQRGIFKYSPFHRDYQSFSPPFTIPCQFNRSNLVLPRWHIRSKFHSIQNHWHLFDCAIEAAYNLEIKKKCDKEQTCILFRAYLCGRNWNNWKYLLSNYHVRITPSQYRFRSALMPRIRLNKMVVSRRECTNAKFFQQFR